MERTVRFLAEDLGSREYVEWESLYAARDHIVDAFRTHGLEPRLEPYTVDKEGEPFEVFNVIAEVPGVSRPTEIVLIGAHYDTAPMTRGANDNGSGVAALLELARVISESGNAPARTIRFVAFTNEEPPFFHGPDMGSARHALAAHEAGEDIVAMIALETMGYYDDGAGSQNYPPPFGLFYPDTGDFIAFVGNLQSRSFVRRAVETFRETARIPSEGVAAPGWLPGIYWSDHHPFWRFDVPALMVTDTAPFRDPNYHRWDDAPENLDYRRLALVLDGLVAVVEDLAATPDRFSDAPSAP